MKAIKYFMLATFGLGLVLTTACKKEPPEGSYNDGTEEFDPLGGDKRGRVAGTYPVEIDTPLPSLQNIPIAVTIAPDGRNNLSVSGSVSLPDLGSITISAVLSDLEEFNNVDGRAATGYYFNLGVREYNILGRIFELIGTDRFDGYDGMVYRIKDGSEAYFGMELSNVSLGGGLTLAVETATE